MSVAAPAHPVTWSAPAPLWDELAIDRARMATPVLLTLRGDRFMTDLAALLERTPGAIATLRSQPRSHRIRPPGRADDWEPAGAAPRALKLYGAVHGQYNLVAASLVCAVGGLPERRLRTAEGDRVVFVMRRIGGGGGEEGWVPGVPDGAWVPALAGEILPGEERLPMFSLGYRGDEGRPRKLHVGLVPTAGVESWAPPPAPPSPQDKELTRARRTIEIRQLVETYRALAAPGAYAGPVDQVANAMDAVDLWLIDLADFLVRWHPDVWTASSRHLAFGAPAFKLLALLAAHRFADGTTLAARLQEAWKRRDDLLGESGGARQTLALRLDTLRNAFAAPLTADKLGGVLLLEVPAPDAPAPASAGAGADSRAPRQAKLDSSGRVEHVIRCAYVRPHCEPLHGPVVSAPTARFALASFFDPDAPARDVFISLPINTGVKDLRQLRKSVSVAISDQLQAQMNRIGSLKDLMDGTRKEGQALDFGIVCSFSIPIISICALLLMWIIVLILNLIFWWLPWFRVCFAVPKGRV